jgi:hypothetical protein
MVQTITLAFLGCWALMALALVISVGWSPCYSRCSNTCWHWHFLIPDGITKCMIHVTLMWLFLCSTFWKPSGLILTPIVGFFSGLLTWARICFPFNICFFKYHVNMSLLMSLFMCKSKVGTWLLVHFTTPTFRLSSAHFSTTLCTHFDLPHFRMVHLSRC